jgi:hypothetical protein
VLSFLRDNEGNSPGRDEWNFTFQADPVGTTRILSHLQRVDASQSLTSAALRAAEHIEPDLYYFRFGSVGVVYAYDGIDIVILAIGIVHTEADRHRLIEKAKQRL